VEEAGGGGGVEAQTGGSHAKSGGEGSRQSSKRKEGGKGRFFSDPPEEARRCKGFPAFSCSWAEKSGGSHNARPWKKRATYRGSGVPKNWSVTIAISEELIAAKAQSQGGGKESDRLAAVSGARAQSTTNKSSTRGRNRMGFLKGRENTNLGKTPPKDS